MGSDKFKMTKSSRHYLLSPNDERWFAKEYIEQKGNLYKCLICPEQAWKTRVAMGQHQRTGVTHSKLLKAANKKENLKESSQVKELILYYHSELPGEQLEGAIPVTYESHESQAQIEDKKIESLPQMLSQSSSTLTEGLEQADLVMRLERCVYSAERINGYHRCIWCDTPETPFRKYRRCKGWRTKADCQQFVQLRETAAL